MKPPASATVYLQKAERALKGAQATIEIGDFEGACNRAYYAMFDAANAALIILAPKFSGRAAKTHSGLISVFSEHIVRPGHVDSDIGSSLGKVERWRLVADYTGDLIDEEQARWALAQAETFVAAVKAKLAPVPPPAPV